MSSLRSNANHHPFKVLIVDNFVEVVSGSLYSGNKPVPIPMGDEVLHFCFNSREPELPRLSLTDGDVYITKEGVISIGECGKKGVLLAKITGRRVEQFNKSDIYVK